MSIDRQIETETDEHGLSCGERQVDVDKNMIIYTGKGTMPTYVANKLKYIATFTFEQRDSFNPLMYSVQRSQKLQTAKS